MLLAIDMGNTQTALGLFDGEELVHAWRMPTDRSFTADELHVRLHGYFRMYDMTLDAVDAVAFAGVVPELNRAWRRVAERLSARAVVVGPDTAAVTRVRAKNPAEVGADRIANATAAVKYYGAPAIVVDFGTATNIDVVDDEGYYIGGAIAPGLRISMDALVSRAARLSSVPLEAPAHAIGANTVEAVQSGAVLGTAAMAEGLVARIKRELGAADATVIATGGLAPVIAGSTDVFDAVDSQLTLRGICEIYRRVH
ncbi:type III pantothenate kinase [Collinsella intestinalis]|uniref:type III pantothenate kinase n=1 Tax=Collinsella intestinalis TaxID=147207 RepID=UPI001956A560|nr:type III pantothenate kinase [Collinsella intestinalis]MBM6941999.1 type III pantothenate kinase [Collinsella intestinalis]MDM8162946.1 type III pantothenate kinase [Collinsella intestinalis]